MPPSSDLMRAMKIAFLDRDGTLIEEPSDGGLVRPEHFRILDGVIEGLQLLLRNDYQLIMVSNQEDGETEEGARCVAVTQRMLREALAREGIAFHRIFVCMHTEYAKCACRKPKTGLVDPFLQEHTMDRVRSLMIGDRELNDGGFAEHLDIQFHKMNTNGRFPVIDLI